MLNFRHKNAAKSPHPNLPPSAGEGMPEAHAEIELTDGCMLETHCREPLGAPENPLTRAQLEQKFRTYARARLPETRIAQIIDAVYDLEALPSARSLIDALRA